MQHSAQGLGRFKLENMVPCQTEHAAPEAGGGDPKAKFSSLPFDLVIEVSERTCVRGVEILARDQLVLVRGVFSRLRPPPLLFGYRRILFATRSAPKARLASA
jgi:hypothetical protein